jgi:hypothetical protein
MQQSQAAISSLIALLEALIDNLDSATPERWRWILQMLDTRIVTNGDKLEISLGASEQVSGFVFNTSGSVAPSVLSRPCFRPEQQQPGLPAGLWRPELFADRRHRS